MIFDSRQMVTLRERFRDAPNYEIPDIVFLDRYEGYAGERDLLEVLLTSVSEQKQRDWLGRLVNEDSSQHIGAWFEIMLFGWLREQFAVQVEPEILGHYPDFVLDVQKGQLAIESRAFLITPAERERRSRFNRIFSSLGSIERPFTIKLKIGRLGGKIVIKEFTERITRWLDSSADQELEYQDKLGNILSLSAAPMPTLKKIGVISSEGLYVNPNVLKPALRKKAGQHEALRKAGYPYVIAVFLEPSHLSAEEVAEAWLGKVSVVYDLETNQVVEEKFDQSGAHYFGKEIMYRSVTGTLVFRSDYDKSRKSRYLRSWYVQNPYANVMIDPATFPAESRFVVIGQDENIFEMKWVK